MIKTIFSGNKKRATRVYVIVYGDGRGCDYKYETWPTRLDRARGQQYRSDALYRINVFPKHRPDRSAA